VGKFNFGKVDFQKVLKKGIAIFMVVAMLFSVCGSLIYILLSA